MSNFKLTVKAKEDLKNIAKFTEKTWNKKQRNSYLKQFDNTFKLISNTPGIGKDCDFIKEGYLKYPQGSHIIFYKKVSADEILVVRILHKQMDVRRYFS